MMKTRPIHPFFDQFKTNLTVTRVQLSKSRKPLISTASNAETISISSLDSDACSDVVITGENSSKPDMKWKQKPTRDRRVVTSKHAAEPTHTTHLPSSSPDIFGPYQLFFFDLEATGKLAHSCHITDLGILERGTGRRFSSLVDIGRFKYPEEVQLLTGITKKDLKGQPSIRNILGDMIRFVEGSRIPGRTPVLVAHNGKRFDFQVMTEEAARSSISLPSDWLCMDTIILAQAKVLGIKAKVKAKARDQSGQDEGVNQAALRGYFGLPLPIVTHRALPDAEVLSQIFEAMMTREILPVSKGRSLFEVFDSIGVSNALFPLSSISPRDEKLASLLEDVLPKELTSFPDHQLLSMDELTALSSTLSSAVGQLRTREHKKVCFMLKSCCIVYAQSENKYSYDKNSGLEPQWKLQLSKSKDVDLVRASLPPSSSNPKMLSVHLHCIKEISNCQVSWSLKTRLTNIKTALPIPVRLDSCRIDSADLEQVKQSNLELVDKKLKWSRGKKFDILVEAHMQWSGIKLSALQIFVS